MSELPFRKITQAVWCEMGRREKDGRGSKSERVGPAEWESLEEPAAEGLGCKGGEWGGTQLSGSLLGRGFLSSCLRRVVERSLVGWKGKTCK